MYVHAHIETPSPKRPFVQRSIKVTEKQLEQKLVKAVKNMGGLALKFTSPGNDGMPDRILLFKNGVAMFVEVKAPGEKPRPLQLARHRMLRKLGFRVFILDDEKQIGVIINAIQTA